ncbi:MAG: hypothetical protein A3B68_07185 [Candidatus Melainabacteria bacterium RIFCSPHIGHO2_02_FULL_34_12]|nr:MAG: hypothetical protein A3B68_07185 [Candidatus Melainabacteria bacterium RIFCSPHIGHO2_02_FULL_34_12]
MLNKKLLFFSLFTVLFLGINASFAQSEDIVLGGKAICTVSGKSPVKRFTADANRLLILQSGGISKGSIQLQLIQGSEQGLIDVNILALLGEIDDLDLFFNGNIFNFENNTSEITLIKTIEKNNLTVRVNNSSADESLFPVTGKIKISSPDQSTANGTLNLKVSDTSFLRTNDLEENTSNENNGKLNIRCRLKDVPVEINELLF